MWETWKNVFTSIADKHAPLRTRKVRSKHTPWLTNEIKKQMNHRDYLKQKATQTKSRHFYEAYKIARNKTNKMVEKAKSRHFQHTINNNSNDPKQLWKGVNLTVLLRNNLTENAYGTRPERVHKCVPFAFQFAFHFHWNASRNAFQ